MSAIAHLCGPYDLARLEPLVTRAREEAGQPTEAIGAALTPLLHGGPEGAAYLFGPPRAPVGYGIITFSYSPTLGAMTATIAELYVRPSIRRRGIGEEALRTLAKTLAQGGIETLNLTPGGSEDLERLAQKLGFETAPTQLTRRI